MRESFHTAGFGEFSFFSSSVSSFDKYNIGLLGYFMQHILCRLCTAFTKSPVLKKTNKSL